MYKPKILVACEESGEVRSRLEKFDVRVISCDLQPDRNNSPNHYQGNLFDIINDGWDCIIAFPPCTHLAVSGAAWFEAKKKDGRQKEGIEFFMNIVNCNIVHKAIENPVGIMSNIYRKPDQIIQPYFFGDEAQKTTCLWLYNLPPLYHNAKPNLFDMNVTHVSKGVIVKTKNGRSYPEWCYKTGKGKGKERSKTYPGIAAAMAEQWGKYLIAKYNHGRYPN